MNIRMVVFDMAGTTINEDNIVYKTLQSAINTFGIEVELNEVLAIGAGKEKLNAIKDIIKTYGNDVDFSKAEQIFELFMTSLVHSYEVFNIEPMPFAESVLMELKKRNILVVLNTGYDRKIAEFILNKINWQIESHFDLLVTATDVLVPRPAPDMIKYAMNILGVHNPSEVIKIGDSQIDIEEGKNANCLLSIGITTGAQTKSQLALSSPDYIIDNLNELLTILN
jgi:phosphonatase-like hydrolase